MGPLLTVRLNGTAIATINASDLPCEIKPSCRIAPGAIIAFTDAAGREHVHALGELSGWAHFSIRVHKTLVSQVDCVVSGNETLDPGQFLRGGASGIRFQPFFLPGAGADARSLEGQGLFARGLHFNGTVTPGSVRLSCECDACRKTFQVQSFHAGFANVGYFYSDTGRHTLIVDSHVAGAPPALGSADRKAVTALEKKLPPAPDGSRFRYLNPFRCPHCSAPYIDFERHPKLRETEYYGNTFFGCAPIHYAPDPA